MNGNFLLNLDENYISYDFQASTPLIGERVFEKAELEKVIAQMEQNNQSNIRVRTNQLDGLHIRELPISQLDFVIKSFEKLVEDLKNLKVKYEEEKN